MVALPIKNPFTGAASFHLLETTSTMDEARRLTRLGFPVGTVICADFQSAGRGRLPERAWVGERGRNLLGTLILGPGAGQIPGFTLRMGLALCRAVDIFSIQEGFPIPEDPRLKWPNDVLVGGRKLAGILCEADPQNTFVGFGINVNQRDFPPELESRVTSLALLMEDRAQELDGFHLLEIVLDQIFLVLGESSWKEEIEAVLWRRGEAVRFLLGLPEKGEILEGKLLGIDPTGALLIAPGSGEGPPHSLISGELLPARESRVDRGGPNHIR